MHMCTSYCDKQRCVSASVFVFLSIECECVMVDLHTHTSGYHVFSSIDLHLIDKPGLLLWLV